MKTWCWLVLAAVVGCSADPDVEALSLESHRGDRAKVFPPGAHPYGRSMIAWAERWWRWTLSVPAPENPFFDQTGEHCDAAQEGKVWFLAGVADPGGPASLIRSCTIPEGKAILVTPAAILNDYPCPNPNFQPAPGQSLFEFLSEGAAAVIDRDTISVTIDGDEVDDPFDFRFASPRLFELTGDPSLRTTLDGCITGTPQPAVSDGYFFMLKPPRPGPHTVVLHTVNTAGTDLTLTWELDIAGR